MLKIPDYTKNPSTRNIIFVLTFQLYRGRVGGYVNSFFKITEPFTHLNETLPIVHPFVLAVN